MDSDYWTLFFTIKRKTAERNRSLFFFNAHFRHHPGVDLIATQMRASGMEPAYTDFIHAVRQGFVEQKEQ